VSRQSMPLNVGEEPKYLSVACLFNVPYLSHTACVAVGDRSTDKDLTPIAA